MVPIWRGRLVLLAGAIGVLVASPGSAAGGTMPRPAQYVGLHRQIESADPLRLVAGTTDVVSNAAPEAIIARYNARPALPNTIAGPVHDADATSQLITVDAAAAASPLARLTPSVLRSSMTGPMFTELRTNETTVKWWDVVSGASGSVQLQQGVAYLGSSPSGWLTVDQDGEIFDNPANGAAPQSLGRPFPNAATGDVTAVSGPDGVVVSDHAELAYISYASGALTALDTSDVVPVPGVGFSPGPQCWSVSSVAAACGTEVHVDDDQPYLANVFIDPLDGSAPLAQSTKCMPSELSPVLSDPRLPTLLGTTAAWISCGGRLTTLSAGERRTTARRFTPPVVAAGNGLAVVNHAGTKGLVVSRSGKTTELLVSATQAHAEALGFALAGKRLIWSQDNHGLPAAPVNYRRRATGAGHGHDQVALGPAARLAARGTILAASRHLQVYGTASSANALTESVKVLDRSSHRHIRHVSTVLPVSAGDGRVVLGRVRHRAAEMQMSRPRAHSLRKLHALTALVSGHYLAMLRPDGRLVQRNLRSGRTSTVYTSSDPDRTQIFEHGQAVGWFVDSASGYRTAPRALPIALPSDEGLVGLGASQALVESIPAKCLHTITPPVLPCAGAQEDFLVRSFDSSTTSVVVDTGYIDAAPVLGKGIVCWIDAEGRLVVDET